MRYMYGVVLVGMMSCALSAEANQLNYDEYQKLFGEPVTTGATGTPMRMSDVPLDMDIITQDDIKRSAARDIPDLLRQVRGVSVRRNGNGWADVSIRGYNQAMASRVLVMLDGRQVYEEDYGFVAWDLIPVQLSEIQQIEIVRGPNTALYGFNANSGVINIITKNPLYNSGGNVSASQGIEGYTRGSAAAGGKVTDKLGIDGSVGGYKVSEDIRARGGFAGTVPLDSTPQNMVGHVDGIYQLDDKTQLGISASTGRADENIFLIGGYTMPFNENSTTIKADLSSDTKYGLIGLQAYHTHSQKSADGAVPVYNVFLTDIQANDVFKVGTDHTFRVQGGLRHVYSDVYPQTVSSDQFTYNIPSVSGLWNWKMSDEWSWTNALRYDRFYMDRAGPIIVGTATVDQYDREMGDYSVNSGLVYKPSQVDTWRLSYARGVDLPSITELATQFNAGGGVTVTGNPLLPIGITHNVQLGYERKIPSYDMAALATVFYQTNDDLVSGRKLALGGGPFVNALDSEVAGFELGLNGNIGEAWRWGASYGFSDVNDQIHQSGLGRSYENANSNNMLKANLGYSAGNWTADTFLSYNSRFKAQNTAVPVSDVIQLDAHLGYQLTENWSTGLTVIGATRPTWTDTGSTQLRDERQAFVTMNYSF